MTRDGVRRGELSFKRYEGRDVRWVEPVRRNEGEARWFEHVRRDEVSWRVMNWPEAVWGGMKWVEEWLIDQRWREEGWGELKSDELTGDGVRRDEVSWGEIRWGVGWEQEEDTQWGGSCDVMCRKIWLHFLCKSEPDKSSNQRSTSKFWWQKSASYELLFIWTENQFNWMLTHNIWFI